MSEELSFDSKKKKKKTPAILEESEKTPKEAEMPTNENVDPEFTGKKKKKKGKEKGDEEGADTASAEPETMAEGVDEFSGPKKRKNKDKNKPKEDEKGGDVTDGGAADVEPDYTYSDLLARVYNIMRDKNPDMMTGVGERRTFVMRPPQVLKAGSKKTAFANFADICKLLKRQPKHLLTFLLAELGTSGSIDGNEQLIIKGKFQQKHIESVLKKYIKEYVTCHTCKSPETLLQKDTRLFFLQCERCGSRCSVASIKTGFQALTGRRAQARNAATTML